MKLELWLCRRGGGGKDVQLVYCFHGRSGPRVPREHMMGKVICRCRKVGGESLYDQCEMGADMMECFQEAGILLS